VFRFKLEEFLEENKLAGSEDEKITKNMIAREAKVRPNVVYEMAENQTKRIELKTLDKIMATLCVLTGREVRIEEILEYTLEK
jgi:DNA-binding Xre family transcriptional regulator